MTQKTASPQLVNRDKEMIPRVLLRAMFILAMSSLVVVGYARITDRPLVGQPLPSTEVNERTIVMAHGPDGSISILDESGATIASFAEGQAGFIAVVLKGLERERLVHRSDQTAPVRLVDYENGRLAIYDDTTGWSVELASFGKSNRAVFAKLLD